MTAYQFPVIIDCKSILRGIRNFRVRIDDLSVREVMISAPKVDMEDDQRLTNAWPDGLRRIQLTRKDNKLKGSTKVMVEAVRK